MLIAFLYSKKMVDTRLRFRKYMASRWLMKNDRNRFDFTPIQMVIVSVFCIKKRIVSDFN